jgi:hypothetical protein
MAYSIWSNSLLLEEPYKTCCYINEYEWNKINELNAGAKRIFAKITAGEHYVICALGQPVCSADVNITNSTLFLPTWAIQKLKLDGVGEQLSVEWCSDEYFPNATQIILRPHDYAFYESDVKKELEYALTQYGVLELGICIPINLEGSEFMFDIIHLEPASIVLMEGDEVEIEFEKSFNQPEVPKKVSTVEVDFDSPILPSISIPTDNGNTLGGLEPPRAPDGRRWNPWRNMGLRPTNT